MSRQCKILGGLAYNGPQYGEVVLLDDSTGQGPDTLAPPTGGSRRAPREHSEQRECKI